MSLRRPALALLLGLALSGLAGCITIGRDFPVGPVNGLEVGRTTRQDVREAFGPPWRTGLEDGQLTWTYGYYQYGLFFDPRARDLVLRFDDRGVLASYSYNATREED
ncbi:MAG: outer membrane protein assembly factor BamE [Myxococcota bacterium]|nr:outer membrane protein assembly factor BamE [Myxococcota bacterium]